MDFNLNLNGFFSDDISIVKNSLLPLTFRGDARQTRLCQETVSVILDDMGEASAKAQGLIKPITSADRLRNSDHTVYLLVEKEGNEGKGTVVGMLKMGRKSLYVFDEFGNCHNQISLCVLDFYVHESRQRMGYGRELFDFMLEGEGVAPVKLAIDRPSEKFLSFLKKHYGLEKIVRQNNNFVVFSGFFNNTRQHNLPEGNSPRKSLNNTYRHSLDDPVTYNGRFTAHKQESTIGKCLNWSDLEQTCSAQHAPKELYAVPTLASISHASSRVGLI